MRIATTLICLLGLCLGGTAAAAPPNSYDRDLAAITAFNKQYLQSINDGDFATLSKMTSADHIMMMAGRPEIAGKAANDDANRRAFDKYHFDETWTITETVIQGSLAFQRGTFTSASTPKSGGPRRSISGKILRIYRRQADGSWTMYIDNFSSDSPGPGL